MGSKGNQENEFLLHSSIQVIGKDPVAPTKNQLGTFFGVYVPTILGTFGVVIFLRLSWITGQAGLINTLIMYCISYLIVGLTVLSVSAIATNGVMKGGGTYYLISRSLGPEFGGSLGVIFFAANITGCGFFVLGFTEAIVETFGLDDGYWAKVGYATLTLVFVGIVCTVGANLFAKTAFAIFVVLVFAVFMAFISYWFQEPGVTAGYTGLRFSTFEDNLWSNYGEDSNGIQYSFQACFALLFPSTIGLLTGTNLSGDLADPAKSLPIGTLLAAITTVVVYVGLVISFAGSILNWRLATDYYITQQVNFLTWAITAGIIAATVSSALATLIGGSRILQALAKDDLIPGIKIFAKGSVKGDEPRRGVVFSWLLVQVLLLVPNINFIAPYISLLYLLSFTITNFATFVCSVAGLPNFRPTFKYFHWTSALLGSILSFAAMFFIDHVNSGVSIALLVVLWFFIHFRAPMVAWGDVSQALIYHQVRKYLLRIELGSPHVKIWRPGVLLLVSSPRGTATPNLIDATNSLKKGGLFIVANILVGKWKDKLQEHQQVQKLWQELVNTAGWKAFVDLIIAPSVRIGVQSLVLSAGVGGMKPNTVVLGHVSSLTRNNPEPAFRAGVYNLIEKFPSKQESLSPTDYVGMIKDIIRTGKNTLVACNFGKLSKQRMKKYSGLSRPQIWLGIRPNQMMTIDAWIVEDFAGAIPVKASTETTKMEDNESPYSDTSTLIIMLAYILSTAHEWKTYTKIRVMSVVNGDHQIMPEQDRLKTYLTKSRIKADVEVVAIPPANTPESQVGILNSIILQHSTTAAISFFPLGPLPLHKKEFPEYAKKIDMLSSGLGPMYMVRANEKVFAFEI